MFSSRWLPEELGAEWTEKLQKGTSTFITRYHLAADMLLPINLFNRTVHTSPPLGRVALQTVATELLGADAALIVLETVESIMDQKHNFSLVTEEGDVRHMWKDLRNGEQPLTRDMVGHVCRH